VALPPRLTSEAWHLCDVKEMHESYECYMGNGAEDADYLLQLLVHPVERWSVMPRGTVDVLMSYGTRQERCTSVVVRVTFTGKPCWFTDTAHMGFLNFNHHDQPHFWFRNTFLCRHFPQAA
jgi:hypothetical protein